LGVLVFDEEVKEEYIEVLRYIKITLAN